MTTPQQQPSTGGKLVWVAALGGFVTLISPFLMGHIEQWESGKARVLVAYADKLAANIPTVCNGLTRHVTTTPIVVGERWTDTKCEIEEQAAMERLQRQLLTCFTRLPPPRVLDMASSHAWNFGPNATCTSLAMSAWNRGEWVLGCERMSKSDAGRPVWSSVSYYDKGVKKFKFVQGLANRRNDESAKCAEGL